MSGKKIITKRFSDLSERDKAAVVDAAIWDVKSVVGRVAPQDRKAMKRQITRITKKAVEYGIYK